MMKQRQLPLLIAVMVVVLGLAACSGELGTDDPGEPADPEVSTNALLAHPQSSASSETRSEGSGTLEATFREDEVRLSGDFESLTSSATNAVMHIEGVSFDLNLTAEAETEGSFEATLSYSEIANELSSKSASEVEAALKSGSRAVVVLETEDNPEGELFVWLSSDSEVYAEAGILIPHPGTVLSADTATDASGQVSFSLDEAALALRVTAEFENLTSAASGASLEIMGESFAVTLTEGSLDTEGSVEADVSLSVMLDALIDAGAELDIDALQAKLESGNAAVFSVQSETNADGELFAFVRADE